MADEQQPPPPPDAPDQEKMDQIRRRRMEKLSGHEKPKSENEPTPYPPAQPAPKAQPKINIRPAVATSTPSSENPFTKLEATSSTLNASSKSSARSTLAEEDISSWEHRILGQIFRITLDPNQRIDSSNHRLTYLPNLRQELEEENAPVRLSIDKLDPAIVEAVSAIPHTRPPLDYLLPCFKRVVKQTKALRGYAGQKDVILKEAKRLCVSNCIFSVEVPQLFGREPNSATDSLVPYLLFDHGDERGVCFDFLTDLVSRFDEDDTVREMIAKSAVELSSKLASLTMNDTYKPYVEALKKLTTFNAIVIGISANEGFVKGDLEGNEIEFSTILGPFFRISPLQPQVTKEYFSSPKTMDKRNVTAAQEALRLTLQTHQRDLLDITNRFIKAHVSSRNRTLDWFATIMNKNHKRRAMQVDEKVVASDGFMMNVVVVLDGLCEPFMDTTFTKVSRIEVDYLRRSPRIDIKDETKLNADQNESDEFYANNVDGTSNFISEVFFLTLAAHHYGSEAASAKLKTLDREIKYFSGKLAEMEAERPKFANNPVLSARFEAQVTQYANLVNKAMSLKFAIDGVLLDKVMQTKSLLFMRYVTVWLLRVTTQSDYTPDKSIQLPLPATQPDAFKNLPEYVLEDILGNFTFISRWAPDIMLSAVSDELIALCITFLTNSEYIKNPFLKAKLVTLLYHGSWPVYHRTKGIIGDALTGSKFANDHLLHALLKFYIEAESTGASSQFYDKFNIRYEIFQVIKVIWSNDIYKQRLQQESRVNTQFFLKFVNLLLNDATYVLDEALGKFPKIHDLEQELAPEAPQLPPEERTKKEEELATLEGQAQSYMQLTNETMAMMVLFSKNLSASFTMPEIVDRVAAMLDYTLDKIVGSNQRNLKVNNPERYHWRPKVLLGEFIEIYLNLGKGEAFISAVARDGRSYKPANFDNATAIITKYNLKSPEDISLFEKLKARFKVAKEIEDQEEMDFGEPPDAFQDPLLFTLMEDPVILPISKITIDRSTIQSHLLSDPHDPFNRTPLKIEDVIPDAERKAEIQAWKEEMRAKSKAAKAAAAKAETMDTTEG